MRIPCRYLHDAEACVGRADRRGPDAGRVVRRLVMPYEVVAAVLSHAARASWRTGRFAGALFRGAVRADELRAPSPGAAERQERVDPQNVPCKPKSPPERRGTTTGLARAVVLRARTAATSPVAKTMPLGIRTPVAAFPQSFALAK